MEAALGEGPAGVGVCRRSNVKTQALNIHPRSGELLSTDPPPGRSPEREDPFEAARPSEGGYQEPASICEGYNQGWDKGYNAGYIKGFAWGKRAGEDTPRVTPYLRPQPPAFPPPRGSVQEFF